MFSLDKPDRVQNAGAITLNSKHWQLHLKQRIPPQAHIIELCYPQHNATKFYFRGYIMGQSCAVFKYFTILPSVQNGYDILILRSLILPLSTKCLFLQCLYRIYSYLPIFFHVCKPICHNIFFKFCILSKVQLLLTLLNTTAVP